MQTYRDMDTAQVVEFMKDYILPGGRYRRAAVITVVAPGMTDQVRICGYLSTMVDSM